MTSSERRERAKRRNLKRCLTNVEAKQPFRHAEITAPLVIERGSKVRIKGVARAAPGFSMQGRQDAGASATVISSRERFGGTVFNLYLNRSGVVLRDVPSYDVSLIV